MLNTLEQVIPINSRAGFVCVCVGGQLSHDTNTVPLLLLLRPPNFSSNLSGKKDEI